MWDPRATQTRHSPPLHFLSFYFSACHLVPGATAVVTTRPKVAATIHPFYRQGQEAGVRPEHHGLPAGWLTAELVAEAPPSGTSWALSCSPRSLPLQPLPSQVSPVQQVINRISLPPWDPHGVLSFFLLFIESCLWQTLY